VGELIKVWRRKAGRVTLATACMLTAAWIRSLELVKFDGFHCGCHFANARDDRFHRIGRLWFERLPQVNLSL
jgi:hypothetical protein